MEDLELSNIALLNDDLKSGQSQRYYVDRLTQQVGAGMLVLDGNGRLNDQPFSIAGQTGPLTALRAGRDINSIC